METLHSKNNHTKLSSLKHKQAKTNTPVLSHQKPPKERFRDGQARLFQNKYLELLSKTHPLVIWGMYIPVIVYMLYYSHRSLELSMLNISWIFAAAVLSWTLFEYLAHRYLFHWISERPGMQELGYIIHGNHHEYPRDKQRLFMPPIPSLLIASLLGLLFYALLGKYALVFFPGFIFGYLIYASMHYAIHTWAPPFKWMKPLWRNHHLHHYKDESQGFGVSSTLWDQIFHTSFSPRKERDQQG